MQTIVDLVLYQPIHVTLCFELSIAVFEYVEVNFAEVYWMGCRLHEVPYGVIGSLYLWVERVRQSKIELHRFMRDILDPEQKNLHCIHQTKERNEVHRK